ncbi:MAG: peptidoglycan DD-metalloendopeptidase family protein [Acidimicrobiia bacterium]|nr:peptidoglycan DD-metalloendopeptidase family protein [Acidimicrobiia bacterium]
MQSRPRFLAFAAALAAVVAIGVVPTGSAAGAPGGDRKQELQAQIGEASQQEFAAIAALQEIQDRKTAIDARVVDLDAQVSAAQAKLAPLEAEAQRLTASYTELQAQVARTQAELDTARVEFEKSAASLYRSARRGETYDVVLASRPDTMVKQGKYLDQVSVKRRQLVERVTELRAELEQQRRSLEAEKATADQAAADAQAIRDQVASLRAEVEPARADAATQESAEQSAIDGIQAQKADFEEELASLQAASDSIAARLRAMGSTPGSAGPCGARPVPGGIVSPFGPRYHPILHYTRMHTGADMSAGSGTPIHACRAGTVVISGSQGGYGNAVVIDHGGNMFTLYAHQSRIAVEEGQHVEAGDVIGYVGSTGMSTGPHLHFEVRLSGNPVDPASYL